MSLDLAIEQMIRKARDEGAFDDLRGAGKPLEFVDTRVDPAWWLTRKLEEEKLELPAPEAIAQRRELDDIADLTDEAEVRRRLALLNVRIRKANAQGLTGMQSQLAPLDIDAWVSRWRARRGR
jgi:hypothetical protein